MSTLTETLPQAVTSARGFPRAVTVATAARDEARVAVDLADRAVRLAERETFSQVETEERLLTTEGKLPEPGAANQRLARVAAATRDLRAAERVRDLAERGYAGTTAEHAETIRELAERVAVEAQGDVVRTGAAFLAALELREAAYALAGSPAEESRGRLPDDPSRFDVVYWLRRDDVSPRMSGPDGIARFTLPGLVERTRAAIFGFPLGGVDGGSSK